jgi:protein-glutamine gamma-glutamyltransferase
MSFSISIPGKTLIRFISPLLGISAGSCVVLSLQPILSGWVALFWVLSCVLCLHAFYKGRNEVFSYNFRLVSILLFTSLAIAAHWPQGWQHVLAQALVLMLGIKLMELKSQRDAFQLCGLGVLGLGVASLVRFDLGFGMMIILFLFLGLILILWQHVLDQTAKVSGAGISGWTLPLKLVFFALFLTVLTIITGLVLFFAFPRNINPMLDLGSGMEVYRTGFSPEMSPGSVSEIVASNRVAFRAQIDREIHSSRLYWRGAVLWETDGAEWKPGTPHDFQARPVRSPGSESDIVTQTITLNPGRTGYLFGLYHPRLVTGISPVFYSRDGSIKTDDQIESARRYDVVSARADHEGPDHREMRAALGLPPGLDQRIIDLAAQFERSDASPWDTAGEIMFYFREQGFEYSLRSPGGFDRGQSLAEFLLETRVGYCELYAAATTILLRLNNIPARVVVGFWGGEFNPVGGYWIVRDSMAHAWVEAWFDDRGWTILDPTTMPGPGTWDQDAEAVSGEVNGAQGPDRVVKPVMRVVDWFRWQWTNAIIDLTLARQVRMWRSFRSGVQDAWSGLSTPDISFSLDDLKNRKLSLAGTALIFTAVCFAIFWFSRYRGSGTDREAKLRIKAWKRLARNTPGRYDVIRPGSEQKIWDWWEKNYPHKVSELKALYFAQRYGPAPDDDRDARLNNFFRNCNNSP